MSPIAKMGITGGLGLFLFGIAVAVYGINTKNRAIDLKNQMVAQEKSNGNALSAVKTILSEKAGVTLESADQFLKLDTAVAKARYDQGGALMKFITETNSNFNTALFEDLSREITAQFTQFKTVQDKLIELEKQLKNLKEFFPSSWFTGGVETPKVTIVLSAEAQADFASGELSKMDLMERNKKKGD